ncbi:hypothetical protein DRP53_06585 [candidate division WOR-3 bacterium]|uniref:Uncharacterized protein n=1 Tax=candidate division WOR-3 bacterium TaxID=2052148 RepID=A0A660SJ19_UNCW3|nr:MAG: hypothetical protein DRP53_06585 [candidate division WOR-3 bacterium]
MTDFDYELVKVCSRGGKEFYHIYPRTPLTRLPDSLARFEIKKRHEKYVVVEVDGYDVTIFTTGRMLIENLPENSEAKAKAIIEKITA